MSDVRIRIYKEDKRSAVLEESITAFVESKNVDGYLSLIRRTFPSTKFKRISEN